MEYFTLAVQTDTDAYFAQFDDDAIVEDEGREHRGIAEIRKWRSEVPTVHYDVRSVDHDGHSALAKVEISGDFAGSPRHPDLRRRVHGGRPDRISDDPRLVVAGGPARLT